MQNAAATAANEARELSRSVAAEWAARDARALAEAAEARAVAEAAQSQREVTLTMEAMLTALDLAEQDAHLAQATATLMEHVNASVQDAVEFAETVARKEARRAEDAVRGAMSEVERKFNQVLSDREREAAVRATMDAMLDKVEDQMVRNNNKKQHYYAVLSFMHL